MAWLKIESSVARNKKFVKAGPAPSWLWVCGLAYCQEGLTDGFIPREALPYLGVKNAIQLAAHLVTAGLWDVDAARGGWCVHDYLAHNRSSSQVEQIREERRAAGLNGGKASGEARRNKLLQHVEANPKQPSNPSTSTETASTTTTASPPSASIARPQPIIAKRRMDAAWEGERLYVPNRTHQDFVALRGSEPELFGWYQQVADVWMDRSKEPGADMIRFWKARYDEKWPATDQRPPQQSSKPAWVQDVNEKRRAHDAAQRSRS